jgi:hypothetical protein
LDNQEAFLDIWRLMNKKSTEAELTRNTSQGGYAHANLIRARASLLLAGYVAGIVHAANSEADTLSNSQVTSSAFKRVLARIKAEPRFHEFALSMPTSYFEIFPDLAKYTEQNES